jgi:hypothetical protein
MSPICAVSTLPAVVHTIFLDGSSLVYAYSLCALDSSQGPSHERLQTLEQWHRFRCAELLEPPLLSHRFHVRKALRSLSLEKLSGHLAAMPQHVVFFVHATVRVAAT